MIIKFWGFLLVALLPETLKEDLIGNLHSQIFRILNSQLKLLPALWLFCSLILLILQDILECHFLISVTEIFVYLTGVWLGQFIFVIILSIYFRDSRQVTRNCAEAMLPSLSCNVFLNLVCLAYKTTGYCNQRTSFILLHLSFDYNFIKEAFLLQH